MSTPRTDRDFREARLAYKRDAWAKHDFVPGFTPKRRLTLDAKAAAAGCVMGLAFCLLAAGISLLATGCLVLGGAG
jgi:hypothetical protein